MGLDTTHDAWHGSYSSFMRWREAIANAAGLGELRSFEGYGGTRSLSEVKEEGLRVLLAHSDCDGELCPEECKAIADALVDILPVLCDQQDNMESEYIKRKTEQFINGCMAAYHLKETLYFE